MTVYGTDILLGRFPSLQTKTPRLDLGCCVTPVRRLTKYFADYPDGVWVKLDDRSNPHYGGNKPRKLELLLAAAKKNDCRGVITLGGFGTNHGLATATLAEMLGLTCHLVLTPQPITDHVKAHLALFLKRGAQVHRVRNLADAAVKAGWLWGQGRLLRKPLMLIPPGGSTILGSLAFTGAALELAEQIREHQLPEPSYLFVPVGSMGTVAGLAVGLRLAGLRTKVFGVAVIEKSMTNARRVIRLANRMLTFIKENGADSDLAAFTPDDLIINHQYFHPGYGAITPRSLRVIREMKRLEQLETETTYSAKSVVALEDFIRQHPFGAGPILWWNTYAGDRWIREMGTVTPDDVPPAFRDVFQCE